MPSLIRNLSNELVRRGVLRALGAYVAVVWLLAQGLVDLFPAIGLPDWAIRVFLAVTVSATPLVGVVAWKYDLTTRGFLRDKQDLAIERRLTRAGAIGPTTRAAPPEGLRRSMVIASWTDEKGGACEKEFEGPFMIGRDFKADVRLFDDRVSRQHLEVYRSGDDWCVRDMSSLNGSYVAGQAIDKLKIEGDVQVSLDREGPRVRLAVRILNDTKMSAMTPRQTGAGP